MVMDVGSPGASRKRPKDRLKGGSALLCHHGTSVKGGLLSGPRANTARREGNEGPKGKMVNMGLPPVER